MSQSNNRRCLACGADISHKRSDAKYCSGRCRMRYRRGQEKTELIGKLAELFGALPNHYAHYEDGAYCLLHWDATGGNVQTWDLSELLAMSKTDLDALLTRKNILLAGVGLVNFFKS